MVVLHWLLPLAHWALMAQLLGGIPNRPTTLHVHTQFQRATPGGCRYSGTVDGTILEVMVPNATADEALQYRPQLDVHGVLSCGAAATRNETRFTLHGPQYSRDQLEQTLGQRSAISVASHAERCEYRPQFVLLPDDLRVGTIGEQCVATTVLQAQAPAGIEAAPNADGAVRGGGPEGPRVVIPHTDTQQGIAPSELPRVSPEGQQREGRGGTGSDEDLPTGPYGQEPSSRPSPNTPLEEPTNAQPHH